jgi:hypothetical protein
MPPLHSLSRLGSFLKLGTTSGRRGSRDHRWCRRFRRDLPASRATRFMPNVAVRNGIACLGLPRRLLHSSD